MLKFKTNARCSGCSNAIIGELQQLAPASDWNIDLESPDKVLTYKGTAVLTPEQIIEYVGRAGFQASQLS